MSDWFDDYCFGWSNIPTCEFYRWLESSKEQIERAYSCDSIDSLRNTFIPLLGDFNESDINWKELYETLNFES